MKLSKNIFRKNNKTCTEKAELIERAYKSVEKQLNSLKEHDEGKKQIEPIDLEKFMKHRQG